MKTIIAASQLLFGALLCSGVQGQAQDAALALRIMPVGASVTFGTGSTTGNSYRKDLRDLLLSGNNNVTVNMVGEKTNGDFTDNQVEATPGFVISQIAKAVKRSVPTFQPNLVLIDAGTNNCNKGGTVPTAGTDVGTMIDGIFAASLGVTVILTTILANKIAAQDACRVDINTQYAALADRLKASGAKFLLVDMRSAIAPTLQDLADTRHPNDAGYAKMANVWFAGIQQVLAAGLVTAPADNGTPADGGA